MGKKKGKGGKSKNRPSSSSLAASLLPAGASSVGFGGYLGSARLGSSSSAEDSIPFSDADSEVAQHLKRLGRKDPPTQLKALTSLSLLFKKKPGEEILQIVPQWAFEYRRLLHDYNREVRRATHETMTNLVFAVRRGLDPQLKSLMGPWWFSQFDPIPEVSQAARRSLEEAFPAPEKRVDALTLYINEIFIYLDENLKLTPQAMSDKATPADELEDMHQRVISSSLLAVATIIDVLLGVKLQSQDSDNLASEPSFAAKTRTTIIRSVEKMFSTHKYFLEFIKSKNSSVRSATYSVLTSFIKHIPHAYNEGNMKILSTAILGAFQEKDASCHSSLWDMILLFSRKYPESWTHCNVQKVVLNRLWQFLRSGCYRSKGVSYPALVIFLNSVPPNAVVQDQFILNFFQNLWAGRNPLHSSAADCLAFFKAYKECFLWVLCNASRYCTSEDATDDLCTKLINDVLVILVWHDYLQPATLKGQILVSSDGSAEEGVHSSHEKSTQALNISYPNSYLQELGKCVVGILADISSREPKLLSSFCESFKKDCLDIFQQGELFPTFHECLERITNFFELLDQLECQRGQTWPLHCLARPLVAKSFLLIKSLNHPDAIKLLSVLIEIFGPLAILSHLDACNGVDFINRGNDESKAEQFLQAFKNEFVPWCLTGYGKSSSSKLDLLISLIQDEYFSEQWDTIITYATKQGTHSETSMTASDFQVLALLFEKLRERISSRKMRLSHENGSTENWIHSLLDSAAVSIVFHPSYLRAEHAHFLCSVLGGSLEDDQICFLTKETVVSIFENVLRSFAALLGTSLFGWARFSSSLLLSAGSKNLMQIEESYPLCKFDMAQFAFEVLEGSIFYLKTVEQVCGLVPSILAAVFIMDWECCMQSQLEVDRPDRQEQRADATICTPAIEDILEDNSQGSPHTRLMFGRRVHVFHCKLGTSFWRSLSSSSLSKLGGLLVECVRLAIFETDGLSADRASSLYATWVLNLVEVICQDRSKLQILLDQLLSEGDSWPMWVGLHSVDGNRSATFQLEVVREDINVPRHRHFMDFVDKLISCLGVGQVIYGQTSVWSPETSMERDSNCSSYSRSWLAVEILCSWRWHVGSALGSFLPSLSEYAKSEMSSAEVNVLCSIVNILLDGALLHAPGRGWVSFIEWTSSNSQFDNIQDPFLRALVSLLFTLIVKDKVWEKRNAIFILEHLVNKLYIGETVNRTCLRILPFILNVIFRPSLHEILVSDETSQHILQLSPGDDFIQESMLSWLQNILSFPSLGSRQTRQHASGLEEWIQVILSCYPLKVTAKMGTLKVEVRDSSVVERNLLLALFRKQRLDGDTSVQMSSDAVSNCGIISSTSVQMILAELTAISAGYCWMEFTEEDWDFVFAKLPKWIESSILLMEEFAEKIDATLNNYASMDKLELEKKLESAVQALEPSPLSISSSALTIVCLLTQLDEFIVLDGTEFLHSVRSKKWSQIRDHTMENVLRLIFTTGVSEAIASSHGEKASSIVASSRLSYLQFWNLVALSAAKSSSHVRKAAVQSMDLWGLSKGSVSSLYAILFSSKTMPSLQIAAYSLLSTEPICHSSIINVNNLEGDINNLEADMLHKLETSEGSFSLRDEISSLIQTAPDILEMDLVAHDRVNVFLAWALVLSYLYSLPSSSSTRESLVQYIQDSANPTILDCIFQHIPLKLGPGNQKKKDAEIVGEASKAAYAAKNVIRKCSLLSYVESLWPVGTEEMASLAGSIYGMMLRLLPFYVRNWFTSLRDRSLSSAVETFTKTCCSPSLLSDELSQVKETVKADENFSVTVNRSAYEIIATYKKEESGMDLVIRLPSSYPLRPADVECTRSLRIIEVKQRKWLLSLTTFIRNQNCAVAEAICIWKSNIDKEFIGVEECPICYSITHTTNHGLPRLACKTCKHKFHSACLFKWFSINHKSPCPLCQTPFEY